MIRTLPPKCEPLFKLNCWKKGKNEHPCNGRYYRLYNTDKYIYAVDSQYGVICNPDPAIPATDYALFTDTYIITPIDVLVVSSGIGVYTFEFAYKNHNYAVKMRKMTAISALSTIGTPFHGHIGESKHFRCELWVDEYLDRKYEKEGKLLSGAWLKFDGKELSAILAPSFLEKEKKK